MQRLLLSTLRCTVFRAIKTKSSSFTALQPFSHSADSILPVNGFHKNFHSMNTMMATKTSFSAAASLTRPPVLNAFNELSHPAMMFQRRMKSKLKKYKMKSYSSFKHRFVVLDNGEIMRWRAGKRHNAHSKSKKSKRRLRKPALVAPAYAKVMKKLNFHG